MKDIGENLRKARMDKGLSLKEAQAETKIRQKYLEALEEGDESAMPGEVYCKGFLRSYAEYLGLDGWEMVRRYREWKDSLGPPPEQPKEEPQALGSPLRYLAGILIVILLLFGVFLGRQYYLATRPSVPPVTIPSNEEPLSPPEETVPPVEWQPDTIPRPEISREVSGGRIIYTTSVETLSLEIGVAPITDVCWMEIAVDGRVVFEGMLEAGSTQTWEASSEIRIRAGRPWSLTFDLNGEAFGPEGDPGDPAMTIIFRGA